MVFPAGRPTDTIVAVASSDGGARGGDISVFYGYGGGMILGGAAR